MGEGFSRRNTIMVAFYNPPLMEAVTACAGRLGCDIWDETSGPDLIAIGHFVGIFDRGVLEKQSWSMFVEFQHQLARDRARPLPPDFDDAFRKEVERLSGLIQPVILLDEKGRPPRIPGVRVHVCGHDQTEEVVRLIEEEFARTRDEDNRT